MLHILNGNLYEDPIVLHAVSELHRLKGILKINDLCHTLNLNYKNLERRFARLIGMSPKTYANIERFASALQLLREKEKPNLAAVACECGYYDQNHFIKDFKRFTGNSPLHYLKRRDTFTDIYTDEKIV